MHDRPLWRSHGVWRSAWPMLFAALVALSPDARAAYPDHPIKVIVPFPAGGPTDATARLVSQRMSEVLGQTLVMDNRGGAGGVIATEATVASPADGYTLLFATSGVLAINPALYGNFKVDVAKDLVPIGEVGVSANILVVPAESELHTVADVLAAARRKPGTVTYGSAGNGSSNHLSGELLKSMAGIDIVHVPYKGSAAALQDVMAGRVTMMFDAPINTLKHVQSGRMRVIAVTSERRLPLLPDVPTVAESGLPGYAVLVWTGFVAPKGTPRDIVVKLNKALTQVLQSEEYRKQIETFGGGDPTPGSPEAFGRTIAEDSLKWAKVIKASGAKVD